MKRKLEVSLWRMKTNAARILDGLGIPYELRDYDPGDAHISAEDVARRVSLPPERRPQSSMPRRSRSSPEIARWSQSR
jgi:Cys-tRNA(Pro)/Cys-tRNA(Cys) deacylase